MACGRGESAQLCNDTVCWEHDGSWLETVAATPVKLWMDADLQARLAQKTFGQAYLPNLSMKSLIAYRSGVKLWIDER